MATVTLLPLETVWLFGCDVMASTRMVTVLDLRIFPATSVTLQ